jgi:endonuclease III
MNESVIRDRLVEHGQILFRTKKRFILFTNDTNADQLLNDIVGHPHAFVLACIMNIQVKAERAWLIPYRISEKLGGFSIKALRGLSLSDVKRLMKEPTPLHRLSDKMGERFYLAVQRIVTQYDGDAARIWGGRPSSAEVVYRFLEFEGVGPKAVQRCWMG